MIYAQLRKIGDDYVIAIPKEDIERLQFQEGQVLAVEVRPLVDAESLSEAVQQAFEASWQAHEVGYRYLKNR